MAYFSNNGRALEDGSKLMTVTLPMRDDRVTALFARLQFLTICKHDSRQNNPAGL